MNNEAQLYNIQIENEVLGGMMLDRNICESCFNKLDKDLFVGVVARQVYDIMCDIIKENRVPEFPEVGMRLMQDGGDVSQFVTNTDITFTAIEERIDILYNLQVRRKLNALCLEGLKLSTDLTANVDEVNELFSKFDTVKKEEKEVSFKDTVIDLQNDVAVRLNGEDTGDMMTGLHIFDCRSGFHRGDLIIVAGETSQGKSTLATTLARNMGLMGIPSAYYSFEMGAKQLTARIIARDVCIASSMILYGKMNEAEYSNFFDKSSALSELPIYFDDRSRTSFSSVCASIKKMVRKYGVRIVFIDYLQIMANNEKDNREQLIGDMARDLKRIAVDEDICVVALSQLSRNKEQKKPTISRLRGSGQIEEACDIAVLIYRPEVYGIKTYDNNLPTAGTAQLIIGKGRNIGIGEEIVTFNAGLSFFQDYQGEQPAKKDNSMPW